MRETLYLHLREAADGLVPYAIAGAPGAAVVADRAPLDHALAHATGRRLVLFVSSADVRLASVQVPARQPQKVLQAAPYALEDQLAEDVDTLHFAIGARQADGAHPVAITARSRMEAWLAPLRARNLRADAVVPENLCLPFEPRHWTALVDGERIVVRTGEYSGFTCALEDLDSHLQLADPEKRIALRVYVPRGSEHDFTRLDRALELLPGHASALEVLARHWQPASAIDLLQGAWSQREDWQKLARPWRTAAVLAVAWVALSLTHQGLEARRLGQELKAIDDRNLARFQALFPGETRIVDLAAQAEQQLTALRAGGGRAPLFSLLEILAASLSATPGLTVQSLQFRDGALYLHLTGSDLQALENLRNWFGTRRDAVLTVQDTSAGSEGVQMRLKVSLS